MDMENEVELGIINISCPICDEGPLNLMLKYRIGKLYVECGHCHNTFKVTEEPIE